MQHQYVAVSFCNLKLGMAGQYRIGAEFHQVTKTGYISNLETGGKLPREFENQSLGTGR
jgi:hypothetical protein